MTKVCVIGKSTLKDYLKENYMFTAESLGLLSTLVDMGMDVRFSVFTEKHIKNIKSNSSGFPAVKSFGTINPLEEDFDLYIALELSPIYKKDFDQLYDYLNTIKDKKKPVLVVDSDSEYVCYLNKTKQSTFDSTTRILREQGFDKVVTLLTDSTSIDTYNRDLGYTFYVPYLLNKKVLSEYGASEFLEKSRDIVYVGGYIGRPKLFKFTDCCLENGMSVTLSLPKYDRYRLEYQLVNNRSELFCHDEELEGPDLDRPEYFKRMSAFKYHFIGSGWHTRSRRPQVYNMPNPPYSTFRMIESVLNNCCPISYRTPECVRMGIDNRLLMQWDPNSMDEERRLTSELSQLSMDDYNELKDITIKKIRDYYWSENWELDIQKALDLLQ